MQGCHQTGFQLCSTRCPTSWPHLSQLCTSPSYVGCHWSFCRIQPKRKDLFPENRNACLPKAEGKCDMTWFFSLPSSPGSLSQHRCFLRHCSFWAPQSAHWPCPPSTPVMRKLQLPPHIDISSYHNSSNTKMLPRTKESFPRKKSPPWFQDHYIFLLGNRGSLLTISRHLPLLLGRGTTQKNGTFQLSSIQLDGTKSKNTSDFPTWSNHTVKPPNLCSDKILW